MNRIEKRRKREVNNVIVQIAATSLPTSLLPLLPGTPGTGTGAHTFAAASPDTSFCFDSDSYLQQ